MRPEPKPRTRRAVLRAGALVTLAVPLAACGEGYQDEPDPLAPLAQQAKSDAEAAAKIAAAVPSSPSSAALANNIAEVRAKHAEAIQSEVDRLNRPKTNIPDSPPPGDLAGMKQRLAAVRRQAEELIPALPAYRAGLIGSVAAGCAALQQLSGSVGPGTDPAPIDPATVGVLTQDAIEPMQQALAAEHAAIWVYGLVSAFLPSNYTPGIDEGSEEHRDRRDACARMLTASAATPVPAEPAYLPPNPVTDAKSAMSVVATAEADAAVCWRSVLEHTQPRPEDAELRDIALRALLGSARRGTRWREAAGEQPTALALPGAP